MNRFRRLPAAIVALALLGCATPSPQTPANLRSAAADIDWRGAQQVKVTLTNFDFTPDHLTFRAGMPVRLVLVNDGSGQHDFSAPGFFAEASYRAGGVLPDHGKIALAKDQTVEVDLVPATTGKYPLECTEFLHSMFGMTGTIDVAG